MSPKRHFEILLRTNLLDAKSLFSVALVIRLEQVRASLLLYDSYLKKTQLLLIHFKQFIQDGPVAPPLGTFSQIKSSSV